MERKDKPYPMTVDDLRLHNEMEQKTNIGFYCYIENNILYITHPKLYVDEVNEYWKQKLANAGVKWHTDDETITSVIDLSDYFTGLSNEIH